MKEFLSEEYEEGTIVNVKIEVTLPYTFCFIAFLLEDQHYFVACIALDENFTVLRRTTYTTFSLNYFGE
jgi:hypothetical protein